MYPTIPYLIKDLTGLWIPIPLTTFGVFLVLSIYTGAYLFRSELKRIEKEGLIHPFRNKKGVLTHPHEEVTNIFIYGGLWALLGARLFSILEYPAPFIQHPLKTLFSANGFTFYGGFIFGMTAGLYYVRKRKMNILPMLDTTGPLFILTYGIGRIGCQLAGDGDWGINNLALKPQWLSGLPDWAWAYRYPHNVIDEGIPIPGCTGDYCHILPNPVYPTPLYETVVCFILFAILWSLRKRIKTPGILFSLFLIFNGIERFFIEKIRVDSEYHIGGYMIKQAEIISAILVITGIAGIVYFKQRSNSQTPS